MRLTREAAPYDAIADQWHASPRAFTCRTYLDRALMHVPPGARVLDLGCGTGEPVARYLVDCGYRVVGLDQSARMLEIAARVVPEATLVLADMRTMDLAGAFGAAVAWDSLFHVDRTAHQEVFRSLARILEPGASLLVSAGASAHEGFTSDMFGRTFFYSGHEPSETCRLLETEGFVVDLCDVDDPASRGHVVILATRQ